MIDLLCVVSVNCVKELLQFLCCQDSIREVGFEFVEGQFPIIWAEGTNAACHTVSGQLCHDCNVL